MYKYLLKPLLFRLDPEKAHHITILLLRFSLAIPGVKWLFRQNFNSPEKELKRKVFGLTFPNPVGLAAGFDKDGKHYDAMAALGFGFIEIGTVTPLAQEGNPKPRLFRLPVDKALINRMGFNNEGVDALVNRLRKRKNSPLIIGGNIGKNKITPNENAVEDYLISFRKLYPHVDYFVVNVSSPNTPGLRELQEKAPLTALLTALQQANAEQIKRKPILLKIAPDLTENQLDDILEIVEDTKLDGIIATNTTISRDGLQTGEDKISTIGNGGLSGDPLKDRSTAIIAYLSKKSGGNIPIIGVGGIRTGEDALDKINAGAVLVQVYSGMVYEGPAMVRKINKALLKA